MAVGPDLGPGREFDLIRSFLSDDGGLPEGVIVGPGDDCAVLEGGLVVSVDLTAEGVHFRPEWITWREAGYRAVAAALSDLAAMAAEPLGVLLSLALPRTAGEAVGKEVVAGGREAMQHHSVPLLGGDLTASASGLVLDAMVLGRARAPTLRTGSRPGDDVWVTGWLGGSATAVDLWTLGQTPPPGIREAFVRPRPRIQEALWLAEREITRSAIDLSDGLAGDAGHLAAASGAAFHLEEAALPIHSGLRELLGDSEPALRLALGGGEDYELCFTAPPGALGEERVGEFHHRFDLPLTRVGTVAEGEGVYLQTRDGNHRLLERGGFVHFQEGESV
jgi:thiamine-monophosphate kinase